MTMEGLQEPTSIVGAMDLGGADIAELATRYREADPFPHIALDGLFPAPLLTEVREEIVATEVDSEKDFYSTYRKRRISDLDRLPRLTRQLVEALNSDEFLAFLEKLTGIEGLVADPYLEGGGVHQIGTGGFLKIHTDFNFHEKLQLHRRLNLLLYLNLDCRPEWGGAIELWDDQVSQCRAKYLPEFNRMVLFSTTDQSYHGHPDPLTCPEDVTRNSIALYYYTADRPEEEILFPRSTMTNYQPRPTERFSRGRMHHFINQAEIRVPAFRWLMSMARALRWRARR
jgi:hypothetical protein